MVSVEGTMHWSFSAVLGVLLLPVPLFQPLPLSVRVRDSQMRLVDPKAPAVQHVAFTTSTDPAAVAPGGVVSLRLDAAPKPNIHVYAPGTKDFLPIVLTVSPPAQAAAGKAAYPGAEPVFFPALNERIPVYRKPFRIVQPVTIRRTAKAGETVTIQGVVRYQACDDQVCFVPVSVPLSWNVKIR